MPEALRDNRSAFFFCGRGVYGLRHTGYRQSHIRVNTPLKKFFDFIQFFFQKNFTRLDSFCYNNIDRKSFGTAFNRHD